jgi:hypothetical protein
MPQRSPHLILLLGLALAAVIGLLAVNYFVALRLLRLEQGDEAFSRLSRSLGPVETPLAFSVEGLNLDHPSVARFSESVGLDASVRKTLPESHPLSIDLEWILAANPYPPTLDELRGSLPPHISFGYLNSEGEFHQITSFGGEADTTPSILTPKARGEQTGYGDFFVYYIFHLKRESATDESPSLSSIDITNVDWSSYAGGSYNGFEEIEFTIVATVAEVAVLVFILLGALWARRRRRLRMPG